MEKKGSSGPGKAAAGEQWLDVVAMVASIEQLTVPELEERDQRRQKQIQVLKKEVEYYYLLDRTLQLAAKCRAQMDKQGQKSDNIRNYRDRTIRPVHKTQPHQQTGSTLDQHKPSPPQHASTTVEGKYELETQPTSLQHSTHFNLIHIGPEPKFDPVLNPYLCDFLTEFTDYHDRMNSSPRKRKLKLLQAWSKWLEHTGQSTKLIEAYSRDEFSFEFVLERVESTSQKQFDRFMPKTEFKNLVTNVRCNQGHYSDFFLLVKYHFRLCRDLGVYGIDEAFEFFIKQFPHEYKNIVAIVDNYCSDMASALRHDNPLRVRHWSSLSIPGQEQIFYDVMDVLASYGRFRRPSKQDLRDLDKTTLPDYVRLHHPLCIDDPPPSRADATEKRGVKGSSKPSKSMKHQEFRCYFCNGICHTPTTCPHVKSYVDLDILKVNGQGYVLTSEGKLLPNDGKGACHHDYFKQFKKTKEPLEMSGESSKLKQSKRD